jgi:hypothetical protein
MPDNYILLERVTVGETAVSSITFNSIPQTGYTDLKIVGSTRSTTADATLLYRFNGTTTGYTGRVLLGTGSVAQSGTMTTLTAGAGGTWGRASDTGVNPSSSTTSTFSNWEMYVPNYTSANNKSASLDAVYENNATAADQDLDALLWSNTAAITSVAFAVYNAGSFAQYSTFSLYGLAAVGTTPTKAPKASGGSIIQTDGTYWYHAFLASGTFTPAVGLSCDVLVVAGGGGGGCGGGGAGGAGGYRTSTGLLLSTATTVTVGGGGTGSPYASAAATNGTDSVFSTITSTGGGKGAQLGTANTGGSGGGGTYNLAAAAGNTPSTSPAQGFAGGAGRTGSGGLNSGDPYASGGGGGAAAVGATATIAGSGAGGIGSFTAISGGATTAVGVLSGGNYYFAGGGGGGADNDRKANSQGAGGTGGGGAGGGGSSSAAGTAGTANTGGGAGGGANTGNGGKGGSGIVVIRYAV